MYVGYTCSKLNMDFLKRWARFEVVNDSMLFPIVNSLGHIGNQRLTSLPPSFQLCILGVSDVHTI